MIAFLVLLTHAARAAEPAPALDSPAEAGRHAWERLARLCDDVGSRPAGSPAYAKAAELVAGWLREDGQDVRQEPVTVPTWVRGEERLEMIAPRSRVLAVKALGGSVGAAGLEAPVAVVHDWAELGPQVAGRIVLYDVPMPVRDPAVEGYGAAVGYRYSGAERAAAQGAVGALVRSVTTRSLASPHTGAMGYGKATTRIPSAAITVEDAESIRRLVERGVEVRLRLTLGAHDGPEATDSNVVGELRGREHPEQVIVLGGHLDSWDVGAGAHDDGAGVLEMVEVLRQLRKAGPARRTIRVVAYANEEHGGQGGRAYLAAHAADVHVAAIESDLGGGGPKWFQAKGTPQQQAWLASAVAGTGLPLHEDDGGGADVGPLGATGTLLVGFMPDDSRYFDVHHTDADTPDKVDPAAMGESIVALARLAWAMADAPDAPLPVSAPAKAPEGGKARRKGAAK